MDTEQEIRLAIGRLSPVERRDLERWMREETNAELAVSEPPAAYGAALRHHDLSVEEYLQLEEASTTKHEYVAGQVFAMSGATARHNVVSMNIATALAVHLRGGPCRAYAEALKVRIDVKQDAIFYYPDVFVACGPQDLEKVFLIDPKLVVEVLSPSTERTDRREKALNYREVPALEEYVLIAQHKPEVTIFRRSENWAAQVVKELNAVAELRSVALALSLGDIYEGAV
jgi:Uma2 family endonuclease